MAFWNIPAFSGVGINGEPYDSGGGGINSSNRAAETPQWMIVSEKIFDSEVSEDKYKYMENGAPCNEIKVGYGRNLTFDSSGENTQDGRLVARPVLVRMRFGQWGPKIQERLFKGMRIEKIELHRIQIIENEVKPIQIISFDNCYITWYNQEGSTILFSFTFTIVTDTIMMYDYEHNLLGNIVVDHDLEAMLSS